MATYSWGIDPAKKKLVANHIPFASMSYSYHYGMPTGQRAVSPGHVPIQQLRYGFRFFFPSNGALPGSPIPRAGQVSPRPV